MKEFTIQRINILFMKKDGTTDNVSPMTVRKIGIHTCYFSLDPETGIPVWELEYMNDAGVVTGLECVPYLDWEIVAISPYYPED